MMKQLGVAALAVLVAAGALQAAPAKDAKLRVVIIDGQNNHNWKATTPVLRQILEDTGRFTVDVSTSPARGGKPAESNGTVSFPPDLSKFDVVLSNYNGEPWPADFNNALEQTLNQGKVGLVIVHAANNAFGNWAEYNQMIGMGWRGPAGGDRLKFDDAGKEVRVPKGQGDGSGHRYTGPFAVVVRDPEHPITKGMPREWMHCRDELYDNMRGPIQNVHLLATAYSKGTMAHEPMIWTVAYGKGRVFHTPMGHDVQAMRCVGFAGTLARGTEWAATGEVTLPLPNNFPTADKASPLPEKK
jgi:type 1 glutamine amidotransferase